MPTSICLSSLSLLRCFFGSIYLIIIFIFFGAVVYCYYRYLQYTTFRGRLCRQFQYGRCTWGASAVWFQHVDHDLTKVGDWHGLPRCKSWFPEGFTWFTTIYHDFLMIFVEICDFSWFPVRFRWEVTKVFEKRRLEEGSTTKRPIVGR